MPTRVSAVAVLVAVAVGAFSSAPSSTTAAAPASRPADVARLDAAYKTWQLDMQRDSSPPEKYAP